MSKRDIETVCTLAAHLAERWFMLQPAPAYVDADIRATTCAQDAMTLQRLGRRAIRAFDKYHYNEVGASPKTLTQQEYQDEEERIISDACMLLSPYGLKADIRDEPFRAECLYIIGLPSNGDGEGFAI